jgi:hypothetical protein
MMIYGEETTRDDGSKVCIGYGLDSDGNVTGRFALPQGHHWDAPSNTESLEFVDSMDALPEVHSDYKKQLSEVLTPLSFGLQ